jgi:hypothetical protein
MGDFILFSDSQETLMLMLHRAICKPHGGGRGVMQSRADLTLLNPRTMKSPMNFLPFSVRRAHYGYISEGGNVKQFLILMLT